MFRICYITEQNMLYDICHVMLFNMCHVMLYNTCHVMLYNICRRRSSPRNVPGGEERGETDVFAG